MKSLIKPSLMLIGCLAVVASLTSLSAQTATDTTDKISQAAQFLVNNQPAAARKVLAKVPKNDANYGQAKAWDALCLYSLDRRKFLKAVDAPEIQAADLPEAVAEDLDFKRIDSLFFYRKFEELPVRVAAYQDNHPDSDRLLAVAEYQMATLCERGIKQLTDAALSKGSDITNRQTEGRDNLTDFLNMAVALDATNYTSLSGRKLTDDIVKAETALGQEKGIMQSLPAADKEGSTFRNLELHCKLQPKAADDNLRRMTNFLNDFPKTKYRERVRYDMADVALNEAQRLAFQERRRDAAAPYLEQAHNLFSRVVEDKEGGVLDADVQEAREKMLLVYCQERDYTSLSHWAAQLTTNAPVGSRMWLGAKLYGAYALVYQQKLTEAAKELDEILATGFKGIPTSDGLLISAAEWRIQVAKHTKDDAMVRRIAEQVQSSVCYDSIKRTFASDYKKFFAPSKVVSK